MVRGMNRVISFAAFAAVLALAVGALAQSPSGFLGLVAKPVPRELARAAALHSGEGAMVVEVVPNGPAASAGIRVGDLAVSIDGHKVDSPEWLAGEIASRRPGSLVTVEVVRQRIHLTFRIVLGTPRPGPPRSDLPKVAGASVRS
jgi:serine protease Do